MSTSSVSYVYRPSNVEGIIEILNLARKLKLAVAVMGAGNSYGDAFQNSEGIVIELSRISRVLEWDPRAGIIKVEPGVTIRHLWRYTIEDGWWPPVVSGTSLATLGGAVSANIHGKNNLHAGPIGEHVLEFELLTSNGQVLKCSPNENSDVFYSAIGGFGLLGVITSIKLQMHRLHSGMLDVNAYSTANWDEALGVFEEREQSSDYIVGWLDLFAGDKSAGRGLIHSASYRESDVHPEESLSVTAQRLPETSLGLLARSSLHKLMRLLVNKQDMKIVNWAKYHLGRREHGKKTAQPIVQFNFLLDSAPNWKWTYKPGGLIQYQPFVPKSQAKGVFEQITRLARDRNLLPFLGVLKRHRPDNFLLTHAVDGYSLAMDFPVNDKNREWLWRLCRDMDEIVLEAGGRFYFAKDSTLTAENARRFLGEETLERFNALRARLDPEGLLQTELSKRVLPRQEVEPVDSPYEPAQPEMEPDEGFLLPTPFWAQRPEDSSEPRTMEERANLEVPE